MSPPHPFTDDHSDGVPPESKTDAGGVVIRPEVAVPQKARCPVTSSHSSSSSASLSGLPPGTDPEQPEMVSVRPSVQGKGVRQPPLRIRLPWSSGKSWSGNTFTPWEDSSFPKSPSLAPAPKPPSLSQQPPENVTGVSPLPAATLSTASSSLRALATPVTATATSQKSSVEVIRVSVFPAGTLPTSSSSQRAPATPVAAKSQESSVKQGTRVSRLPATTASTASSSQSSPAAQVMANSAGRSLLKVADPGCGAQALARGSGPGQGSRAGATAPAGIKPSSLPSGARPPSAVPTAARGPPVRVQFFLKHASGLRPVTLLELPQDSLLLNTPQQPEQRLYQLIPQEQLQQASTSGPQEPVPGGS
ncbi:transcription factor SPT20 homolog, partial [Ailuropoda melanoleuca]|uniref:transcription factor SPT20 homolog n=1 Tax=Ailuropoda melanoleuca TaxID=9646 RepID=UPI001494EC92